MIGRMGEPCSHLCTLVEGTGGYLIIGIERRALKVYVACRGGGLGAAHVIGLSPRVDFLNGVTPPAAGQDHLTVWRRDPNGRSLWAKLVTSRSLSRP